MFRIFFSNWRTFVIALGVILVPLQFLNAVLTLVAGPPDSFFEQFSNPASAEAALAAGPDFAPLIGLGAVAILAAIFVNPFVNGLACRIAAETFEGGSPQPRSVFRSAGEKYWTLIGVTFLVGLIVLGLLIVPIVVLVAGIAAETDGLIALGGFLIFGGILAVIYVGNRLALVYPVVLVERVGPVDAVRRSYRLVKGRWWRVFGTILLAGVVTFIVSIVAAAPFSLPGGFLGSVAGVIFTTIGSIVSALVTTPLTANAQTLLYYDGRIRSEGYDLEVMTRDVLGGSQPLGDEHGNPFG